MKKLLYSILLSIGISSISYAYQNVSECINTSSFTTTNDTTVQIPNTKPGSELFGVNVGSATAGGKLTLFDGQGLNASTKIGVIDLGTIQNQQYLITVSSGITYTITGNGPNGVTITYRTRQP